MSSKRAPGRSLDEWMKLVTECRQSGLTDAAWCTEHGISPSSFYNAVTRLRKRACQIPDPVGKAKEKTVWLCTFPDFFIELYYPSRIIKDHVSGFI